VRALRRASAFSFFNEMEKTTAERVEQQVIAGRSLKSMNFVQSISEEDEQLERKNKDFVHLPPIHNNTFVTVTDARGNKKTGASAGCLEEIKGRSRLSRYAAEATAEHVGRSAINLGNEGNPKNPSKENTDSHLDSENVEVKTKVHDLWMIEPHCELAHFSLSFLLHSQQECINKTAL
jgi:hypothetical protein